MTSELMVRDVMSSPVVTVGPDATFHEIVDTLLAHDISGVVVADSEDRLLGVVTEADLVAKDAYGYRRRRALGLVTDYLRGRDPRWVRKAAGRTAEQLMTVASAAAPDETVAAVARRMLETNHKRLPVVEGDRLVGVVSRQDLMRTFSRSDADILRDVAALLDDVRLVPETHEAWPRVLDGIVRLDGTVQWPRDRMLLEAVVSRVPGVVAVENDLTAREPEPHVPARVIPPLR